MSKSFPYFLSDAAEEVQQLHRSWGWFLAAGAALILVGVLAIGYPIAATVTTVEVFGVLLLVGGAVEIAGGMWARRWGGFFLHLLCGLLSLFVGAVLIDRPLIGAEVYTVLLAVFFVACGLFRVFSSASQRFSGWGWNLLSGAVTFLLGLMIWRQLPVSGLWVIGTFVGIDLIFIGWSWVMLGLAARSIPDSEASQSARVREQLVKV
jgi:uncharacterized membrane protein HdeD (DUF308 family)